MTKFGDHGRMVDMSPDPLKSQQVRFKSDNAIGNLEEETYSQQLVQFNNYTVPDIEN